MTVTLTHTRDNSLTAGGLFRVSSTVTTATNISTSIFLYDTSTQLFVRVATAAEIQAFPDSYATAVTDELVYYRQASATKDFAVIADAVEFNSILDARFKQLCVEQNTLLVGFVGSVSDTVSS